jgi:hypothetical protein
MRFDSLDDLRAKGRDLLAKGPHCLIFCEDGVEVDSTIRHHLAQGFRRVIVMAAEAVAIDPELEPKVIRVDYAPAADAALETAVNAVIGMVPAGTWIAWVHNAEYLFYPFCEDRSIGELTTFCAEERRDSLLTYVVDLYAPDLDAHPDAVDTSDAHFDRSGYFALVRRGRDRNPKERQLDFFGGLRWRFEDRVAIFRAKPGLTLRPDHTFSDEEYNTYACPWHNSPTAAIASFRTAKALKRNPGSRDAIRTFTWPNATRFGWSSQQFLDLGLMEPGQWF